MNDPVKRQCPECRGKWADRDECPFCLVLYGQHVKLRTVTP